MPTYTSPYAARLAGGFIDSGVWTTLNPGKAGTATSDPLGLIASADPSTGTVTTNAGVLASQPQQWAWWWDGAIPRFRYQTCLLAAWVGEIYFAQKATQNLDTTFGLAVFNTQAGNDPIGGACLGLWCGAGASDYLIGQFVAASFNGTGGSTFNHANGVAMVGVRYFFTLGADARGNNGLPKAVADAAGADIGRSTLFAGTLNAGSSTAAYTGVGVGQAVAAPGAGQTWQNTLPRARYVYYPPLLK